MKTENKLGMMPHSYNPSTCETEAGRTQVQGQLYLRNKSEDPVYPPALA